MVSRHFNANVTIFRVRRQTIYVKVISVKILRKRWWNDNLTDIWTDVCTAERRWVKCHSAAQKKVYKQDFINKRKYFDHEVQKAKRHH